MDRTPSVGPHLRTVVGSITSLLAEAGLDQEIYQKLEMFTFLTRDLKVVSYFYLEFRLDSSVYG